MFFEQPIFFEKNRVFRVYTGGKLLGNLMGDDCTDGFFPEEWIASSVKAINLESRDENEGISKIKGEDIYFDKALNEHKKEMLGEKDNLGILVKYLDSAIRLPVQAHPDKAFSRKHFNSSYGKEECWYVLDTRPGACIYFGFDKGVTKEQFEDAVKKSETDKDAMEKLLKKYEVKKGDFVFIPAKAVHAIGAGCLILEIQEPTDFTIQPERWCGDYKLSDKEMYIGLEPETAMECFDFEEGKNPFMTPENKTTKDGVSITKLIDENTTESFSLTRVNIKGGKTLLSEGAAVYIVTEGAGKIKGNDYEKEVKKGDYFFLPYGARDKFFIESSDIEFLYALS